MGMLAIPYGQSLLIAANATAGLDDPAYKADRARDIELSRTRGIDAAIAQHKVDALIAPMGARAKATGKAGAPVVAVPCGMDVDGKTPFGLTMFGGWGMDAKLVRVAEQLEFEKLSLHQTPKSGDHFPISNDASLNGGPSNLP